MKETLTKKSFFVALSLSRTTMNSVITDIQFLESVIEPQIMSQSHKWFDLNVNDLKNVNNTFFGV